ncbi:MAG: HAMP domain-containing protein [Geminicoccaceae bacterium]|nr:HAMP domain-containing protein [Geminicoccaceae bacterium]
MGRIRRLLDRTIVPRSLFGRSLLIVVAPVVILQILLTVVFYNRHWDVVTRWLASGVAGEVALLVEQLEAAPDPEARRTLMDQARRRLDLRLSFEPGARLETAARAAGLDRGLLQHIDNKILEAFAEALDKPFLVELRPAETERIAVHVELSDGLLRVLASRKRVTATTTGLLLAWMVGASIVLLLIAVHFLRLQVRPIRRLARAVESFGMGRDPGPFRPQGAAEVRAAAHAFNQMRERVNRYLAQRTEMLAAVSHDLRTPLTRMKLELELLGDRADPVVAGLRSDVAEMVQLVEDYLSFARGEGRETIELTPLEPILESMRERAERSGLSAEVTAEPGITLPVRPLAFRRCLANLVDNACRHARWVGISARRSAEHVEIAVEDDGPGIPESQRERVFQPFVRLDQSRSRATGGVGLGLTIARDIVLGHGGEISLHTSSRGGLKALVRLPV